MSRKWFGRFGWRSGLLIVGVVVMGLAPSVFAAPFVGTPSPSLSPVFGTLINFDDQATGTPVGVNDYLAAGVMITETEGLGFFGRYGGSQSLPNYIGTGPNGERGTDALLGWDGTIRFDFTVPVDMVGIGIADSAGGPEFIRAYDQGGNLLEVFQVPVGSNVYVGFSRPQGDIWRFEVTGDYFAVDDLQFNQVPEPATLAVFGLMGIAGAGYALRRRVSR